jgi:hypothetical protein
VLTKALSSDSADLRLKAVEILGHVAKRSAAARAVLVEARLHPELRLPALRALWNGTSDPGAVVPALLAEVRAGTADSAAAASFLAGHGAKAAFAIKEIRAAHAAAKDEAVRSALAKAIDAIETR